MESPSLEMLKKSVGKAVRVWFSGEDAGGTGLMVELPDLEGLLQP